MTIAALECPPAHRHVPDHVGTYGPEVADLADAAGMTLYAEQRMALDVMYAHDQHGRLVATEFGCSAPRRNIKSHVGKAAALADLVLFAEPDCLWTAQLRATSNDIFANDKGNGLSQLFENYDFLRRLVAEVKDSDGEQVIRLRRPSAGAPQPALTFMARSERGGRGLSGRRVTFDEALYLKPSMLSAMIPVLAGESVSGAVQARYLGSPGRLESAVWRQIRDRGRSGRQARMAWLEWAAPHEKCEDEHCMHVVGVEGCALDRPHLIRAANLAMDRLIDMDFVLTTERESLTPPTEYMCERMGWWQDPPNLTGGDLDTARWEQLVDVAAQPAKPMVVGVDQGEDRTVSVGCSWRRRGGVQVMLTQGDRVDVGLSPDEAVARIAELHRRWKARVVLGGPAIGLERELKDAGVPTDALTGSDFATACGQLDDRIRAGTVHHGNQKALNDSIAVARWRQVGTAGERAFQLKNAPGIGPTAAVVRALAGLLAMPATPPPGPLDVPATDGLTTHDLDIDSMGF